MNIDMSIYKSTTFKIFKASKEQNSMENVSSFQHFGKSSNNFHEAKTCGFGSHLEAILDHLGKRQLGQPRHQLVYQKIFQIITE